MKKAISLVMVLIMVLAICACGENNNFGPDATDNRIELTPDNFSKYFEVNANLSGTSEGFLKLLFVPGISHINSTPVSGAYIHSGEEEAKIFVTDPDKSLYREFYPEVFVEAIPQHYYFLDVTVTLEYTFSFDVRWEENGYRGQVVNYNGYAYSISMPTESIMTQGTYTDRCTLRIKRNGRFIGAEVTMDVSNDKCTVNVKPDQSGLFFVNPVTATCTYKVVDVSGYIEPA